MEKKNILTCKPGTVLTGEEIKDWILDQLRFDTDYAETALDMSAHYLDLEDDSEWMKTDGWNEGKFCIQKLK